MKKTSKNIVALNNYCGTLHNMNGANVYNTNNYKRLIGALNQDFFALENESLKITEKFLLKE